VYGISLRSEIPLSLPECQGDEIARIELLHGTTEHFAEAIADAKLIDRADWCQSAHLDNGSSYVRWRGLGEFLVTADGKRIWCARAPDALPESFQVYLLGQALSFALVKGGFEPLHGTAIEHEGHAIALLGSSGFGKSTLAASFIAAGCRLLTDDLLLLRPGAGGLEAYPGPPRIKLHPDSARQILGPTATAVPMNPQTDKHVIGLDAAQRCQIPIPLRVIYVLTPPEEMHRLRRVRTVQLSARKAFFALVENTFNHYITDPDRMGRQLAQTSRLINLVPVRKLSYPRSYARLREVREAILADSQLRTRITT
jgi:hypothetical protein